MNNLILIIYLIIAIISLVALIDFKAEKDTAKSKLDSLPQDLQPTRHTTFAERNALKTKFNFEPKDTQVYEIIGEISKSVLKKNGFATEQFFTINGYLVDIPYTAQPYLQPEENIVEVIYENDEAWLISLNNVWYITEDATEQKNRELNHKKIHNAEIGQLKESNIKITGKREANASEHQQLKPTGLGMGSMIAVVLNMCLFLLLFDSRYPALATATSLFLLPLNYWLFIRMRRAHSKPVMVTKMNGKIYGLEESGDELLVYFQPPQLTMASSYAYYAPIKWKKEIERKIDHFVNFEVYPEREKLVSIDKNLSLAADQPEARPQVTPHVSMLIAILIFAQIAFNMVEKPIFDASLQQIWHERKITANGTSELLEQHPNIGEKVVLSGHRQCLKTEKNHWDGFDSVLCQRFYLLDHALPTLSVPDSIEETKLAFINNYNNANLTPELNANTYYRLTILASLNKQTISARKDIRGLSGRYFKKMTELFAPICDYSVHCPQFKDELTKQWQKLLADLPNPSTCSAEQCWQQMVSDEYETAYLVTHKRETYPLEQAMALVYKEISRQLVDNHLSHPLSEPAVLIHLASATQVPPKLEKLYDQLNAQFGIDGLTTFREYLNQVSNFSEIQGVVISARATADSLELVLETDLTQQDFMQQWLVLALLFVLIGLAAIHFTRMVWLIVPPPKKIR